MWRRGERLYAFMVLLVVALEAYALGALVLAFSARLFQRAEFSRVQAALFQALGLTGLILLVLGAYILLYHAYTALKEARDKEAFARWLGIFTEALFADKPPPPPPWPEPALWALLRLREMLKGEMGEKVAVWIRRARPPWAHWLRSRFTSRPERLQALEALGLARLPETLEVILPYLGQQDPVLRLAAARAGARVAQGEGVLRLGQALLASGLSRGALLEALLLLEDRAPPVAALFLEKGDKEAVWAALEALGRLRLHALAEKVLPFLEAEDPEVQAAALRALARLGYPPSGREGVVLSLLRQGEEFLRVQAARLFPLLPPGLARRALWEALKDPSFYVRRAAAEALAALDAQALREAAGRHPDPYGRAMAAQVLREGVWRS
ncbi:HEAT repeat domain-containing protein [Thermus islandicus]|uniref:HEAT repeat domain-containing protein n=1 Tax=Thermus islandicus TaxID=540988 RepID=UPI0003B6F9A2|nr:HEAT repeat domain-containing protein [Thermus islandicus]